MSAVAETRSRASETTSPLWLFSMPVDLSVFLGSALVSLALLWIGARAGLLGGVTPEWAWVPCVLLIDVVLGYASHPDPASVLVPVIRDAMAARPQLVVVGYVLGSAVSTLPASRRLAVITIYGYPIRCPEP